MCIIAIKPAGVKMPDKKTIETMWTNNNDGAGFMYPAVGGVYIQKGYMKLKTLKAALKELEKEIDTIKTPIIFHFRIGTTGGNIPENTHPFPITESISALKKLRIHTPLAVAHNGVIDIMPREKNISDTMEYVAGQLAPLYQLKGDFYRLEAGKKLVYNATHSKLAFMDALGRIETVGKFITENDGMIYSNTSYMPRLHYSKWDIWDDYLKISHARRFQWLIDDDGYIQLDGQIYSASDYLIDDANHVYAYDFEMDKVYPVENATAYNHQGLPLQFNEDQADFMDYEDAPLWSNNIDWR